MTHTFDVPVESIINAARRPEVIAAMRAFYAEADRAIAERNATCWNSGECCRFGQYGHRLFVTALEVAYYLATVKPDAGDSEPDECEKEPARLSLPIYDEAASSGDTCPHAYDGRCHVRGSRPLGCRIFYCDPAAQHWQGPMTESYLARLRAMHEELDVPYIYADWMSVLAALRDR